MEQAHASTRLSLARGVRSTTYRDRVLDWSAEIDRSTSAKEWCYFAHTIRAGAVRVSKGVDVALDQHVAMLFILSGIFGGIPQLLPPPRR